MGGNWELELELELGLGLVLERDEQVGATAPDSMVDGRWFVILLGLKGKDKTRRDGEGSKTRR